ncbi:MAG: hypothetical protein GDA44_13795 [Prochloron sp. SP5CPC1]|nr:hypothetical protein [Candidatus Paraprochloron terpiosi SP5CPC1]
MDELELCTCTLRIPKYLKEGFEQYAAKQEISLEELVTETLADKLHILEAVAFFMDCEERREKKQRESEISGL